MNTLESLPILNARQSLDLIKTGIVLAETVRQLAETSAALATATETIRRHRGEIECLGLDLAEARARGGEVG